MEYVAFGNQEGALAQLSSAQITREYEALAKQPEYREV